MGIRAGEMGLIIRRGEMYYAGCFGERDGERKEEQKGKRRGGWALVAGPHAIPDWDDWPTSQEVTLVDNRWSVVVVT